MFGAERVSSGPDELRFAGPIVLGAHHGSMSIPRRLDMEDQTQAGGTGRDSLPWAQDRCRCHGSCLPDAAIEVDFNRRFKRVGKEKALVSHDTEWMTLRSHESIGIGCGI